MQMGHRSHVIPAMVFAFLSGPVVYSAAGQGRAVGALRSMQYTSRPAGRCRNGMLEPAGQFCVPLARRAMEQIRTIYRDLDKPENVVLDVHEGGHVIDLPAPANDQVSIQC